jgi:hypothetical protein
MADNSQIAFLVYKTRAQKAINSFQPLLDVMDIHEDN